MIYNVAPTNHYLAAIPLKNSNLPSGFAVYFYINTNIISNNATSSSNFTICDAYDACVTLNSVSSSTYTISCKRLLARFSKTGNPTTSSALFTYDLAGVENNDAVNSEYNLHQMTSANFNSPSSELTVNTGDSLKKCIYALGDVDRDGDVDEEDAHIIQMYTLGFDFSVPGRSEEETLYDKIAFELAADYNQDGEVTLVDVLKLKQDLAKGNI